jgi:hypothetical protein
MYTKFITNENWKTLSANYIFDNDIDFKNSKINSDANLNLNYTPFFKNLKDFCNNNYSFLFLTEKNNTNNYINLNKLQEKTFSTICLIANNYIDNKVSVDTVFFSLSNNNVFFDNIKNFNDSFYIELFFYDNNNLLLYNNLNGIYNIIVLDPFDKQIKTINLQKDPKNFQFYDIVKYSFNYIYDVDNKNLVIYKKINEDNLILYKTINNSLSTSNISFKNLNKESLFTVINAKNVPDIDLGINFLSYTNTFNQNNLNINKIKSKYNINNNFLGHIEYNTIRDSLNLNFLTLKNQLNIKDNQNYIENNDNSFRDYKTIHGGGNREEGYENVSINYTSDKIAYTFSSDKNTWFRIPNNKNIKKYNINNTSFFKNGAIAGSAPIYSDKIWKKLVNDTELENTGSWLCSWLSGGDSRGVWMDRFYDNNTFTAFEALKYNSNVNYTPQYQVLYKEGIKDVVSNINIESDGIYSYFHIGKNTANNILKSKDIDLYKQKFDSFNSKKDFLIQPFLNKQNEEVYHFNGDSYGKVILKEDDFYNSNFTLSFFATRKNWIDNRFYNIIGNYLDSGFSIINNNTINIVTHYFINKKLFFLNDKFENILSIDITPVIKALENFEDIVIHSVFYLGILDNFYVVTNNGIVIEYTAYGTLVDIAYSIDVVNTNLKIISTSYNLNFGILLDSNNRIFKIDFKNNTVVIESESNITSIPENYNFNLNDFCVVIDFADRIYRLKGMRPIFKNNNLYYLNNASDILMVYDVNTQQNNEYIIKNQIIKSFCFNKNDETIMVFSDGHEIYDYLGNFVEKINLSTVNDSLSNNNIGVLNFGKEEKIILNGINADGNMFFYNLNYKNLKLVYKEYSNNKLEMSKKNLAFEEYYQGVLNSLYPLPGYTVRLKLINIVNREDSVEFKVNILGETLDSGKHHFSMIINSIEGFFDFYIDGSLYTRKIFPKNKFYFDKSLFNNNIIIGTTHFYNNLLYNNFYNSSDMFFVDDLIIENFKIYKEALNIDENKLIYLSEYGTKDLKTDIICGERNYLDTISRFFKNSLPGQKSNIINIRINDSLIKDKNLQETYNKIIMNKIKDILPAHVKVNQIIWENSKDNLENMLENFFNTENTLTYS